MIKAIALLKTWWPALLVIAMALAIHFYAGHQVAQAVRTDRLESQNNELTKTIKKKEDNAKNLQKIRRLDDDALTRRYCRWVYDVPYDECVRTTVFVP